MFKYGIIICELYIIFSIIFKEIKMIFSKKDKTATNSTEAVNNVDIESEGVTQEKEKKMSVFDKIDNFFLKYNYSYLIWAFFVPAVLMLLVYIRMDVHPFGSSSVLVLDLNGQYVQFFEALRSAIYGDSSFLYSFERSLGGEFLGIYAYYLASPFSYIVALFPKKNILEALLAIFVLKCGSAGLSFGVYMHNSQKCNKTVNIALSTLYAMCSYFVVMHHNTMWIDGLILLPLLALGIERVIKYKKPSLYVVSLSLTLMANYYIGYMSCIFAILYSFYFMVSSINTSNENPIGEKQHFLRSLSRMGIYSIISIGVSAVMLIPAYYSLTFGKTEFSVPDFSFTQKFDFIDFITKMFPGAYDTVYPNGLPWIYSGVVAIILLPLFFLTKKIKWQEKLASGVFVLFLFISMNINTLDMIWHGFQAPNWLNYRYSFMFSFIVLMLAGKAITLIREIGYKSVLASSGISLILVIILQKLAPTYERHDGEILPYFDNINGVWLSIICILSYAAILVIMTKYRADSEKIDNLALIMAFVICAEVFLNGVFYTQRLNEDVVISSYESYHGFYDKHEEAVDYIKETADKEFYRVEKTFTRNVTDAFVFGVSGLASSTSTLYEDVIELLRKLGLKADSHWSEYGGSTPITDSFFGVEYLMTLPEDSAPYMYDLYYENENTKVYKNPYALSLAFASSKDINDVSFYVPVDIEDYEYSESLGEWVLKEEYADTLWSPFDKMNAIIASIAGNEELKVYTPIEAEMTQTSTVKDTTVVWSHYVFEAKNEDDKSACISFTFNVEKDGYVYIQFPTKYAREGKIISYKNGETLGDMKTFYEANANIAPIINLGYFNAGDEVLVDLYIYAYGIFYLAKDTNYFWMIDEEAYSSAMMSIKENEMDITVFEDDYLEGSITVTEDKKTVLTTIPYDEGWTVKVNGEKIDIYETLTCLLAFDLPSAGTYEITMKYYPSIYTVGIVISIVSLAIIVLIVLLSYLAKKEKINYGKDSIGFPAANIFVSFPSDKLAPEYSLIDLEIQEEEKEAAARKEAKKQKRKNKK